ncbi:aminotransferase class I/II-fold pyridoxal phosphate-dependent enzyme [Cellulophaga sp. Hel_I_12]|uniref:pyridoxal phosphate-dependent decarboxylase family protein n=1 Tax=Cellulophaga sp. Hel_I_12 TaxID=1249972 RepID=UPI000647C238|nr:aminotransferase class I/II-fold pyridoxal phosphate-dependent enzyme [Cellulophaga sp. Hel_I_12]
MKNDLLRTAYSSEEFRKRGHQLVDELAAHLAQTISDKPAKVIDWKSPMEEHEFWTDFLENGKADNVFSETLKHSIHVHNPTYIGHQVTAPLPITAVSSMFSALLNNGMAVYEMGMASTAMERIVTDTLCEKIGFAEDSRGFLTSGGTLANLTALLAARKAKVTDDIWTEGHSASLGIIVSEEAHYCADRAARIMGLGEKGIIKIPATNDFKMNTSFLEETLESAKSNGITVFAIIGSAPSTATGMYDDLEAISSFSKKHNLWFHVDGAHGGAAIFSKKYKYTLKGIENADSVVIDGHKMLMMPAITTALLFKDGANSYTTFSQKADYLLGESEGEDWYNLAKRTFECTKTMMSLHWFTLLKTYGEDIFEEYVTSLYNLGRDFAELIQKDTQFELALEPDSNIVCFRFKPHGIKNEHLNKLNIKIRQELLESGEFYVVQTTLRGVFYLRTTLMNPFTTIAHLTALLKVIKRIGGNIAV